MPIVGKGPAPYGFRWTGGMLEIELAEADMRRRAFELFRELKSKAAVARKLNDGGTLTRRGGRWSDVQVGRILGCTSAIGRYVFNKTTGKGTLLRTETSEADRLHVSCEPIIEQNLWDDVAALLESQSSSPVLVDSVVHPLVGIAYCECGQKLRVPSSNTKYVCPVCQNKISIADLEGVVMEDLVDFIGNQPEFVELLSDTPERAATRAAIRELQRALEDATAERAKVEKLYLDGLISPERFGELYRPLDVRIAEQTKNLSEHEKRLSKLAPSQAHQPQLSPTDLAKRWKGLPPAAQRRFVKAFVARIVVGDGRIEFAYLFGDSSDSPSKDAASPQQISTPTNQTEAVAATGGPEYIRLPKAGRTCEVSGLTRAKLNDLILPSRRNNFRPPVKSISLRKVGQTRGVRLILRDSLMAYLRSHAADSGV